MEFRQLEVFAAVAETKSFSKAAEYLYLTQSTVSTHIRKLEEELQTKLIIRSTKSVRLTQEGTTFLRYVRRILETKNTALEAISSPSPEIFRLGASTIPSGYLLPGLLSEFRKTHPFIVFDIRQGDSDDILEQILDGSAELGLIGKKADPSRCVSIPFCEDELVIAMPADEHHRTFLEGSRNLTQLLREPLIMREQGSGTQKAADQFIDSLGLSPDDLNIIASVNDLEAIKQLVRNGTGISIMSRFSVRDFEERGQILTLSLAEQISRQFYMVYLKSKRPRAFVQDFIDMAQKNRSF